jgi:hypothetical protein
MRRLLALGAVLAFAPAVAQAQAASAGANTSDARCLLSMVAFAAASSEPQAKDVGKMAAIYYASRITLRDPSYNFAAQLPALERSMDGPTLQAEAKRCGPPALQVLQSLGAAFAANTPKPQPQPPKP